MPDDKRRSSDTVRIPLAELEKRIAEIRAEQGGGGHTPVPEETPTTPDLRARRPLCTACEGQGFVLVERHDDGRLHASRAEPCPTCGGTGREPRA
jgi:hypothetical protein